MLRRVVVREKNRIVELSALDFLRVLEAEKRIQSADEVFRAAAEAGRLASRAEKLSRHDQAKRDAIRAQVAK